MSKRRVCLIWLLLIMVIICCSTHTSGGQEDDSVNISDPSSLPAKSEISHDDILNHVQRSLDRSINIHNQVAIVMGLLVALITLIVGIGGALGYLKIRHLEENIEQAKESAEKTKGYEEEAKVAADEIKDIAKNIKFVIHKYEEERDKLGERIMQFPSLPESLSKDQKEILDEYKRIIEALYAFGVPLESEDYFNRGSDLYQRGKYESAVKAFDRAIELNSYFAEAWNSKGVALGNLGRYEEALTAIDVAMVLKPNFAFALSNKGVALHNLGRYKEALTAYDKAIGINPNFEEVWNNKGIALHKLDRYDEALTAYDTAIEKKQDFGDAWYNKACTYSLKGDKGNTLKSLSKATDLDAKYKETAKSDDDFKNLWDDEDFKRIVS